MFDIRLIFVFKKFILESFTNYLTFSEYSAAIEHRTDHHKFDNKTTISGQTIRKLNKEPGKQYESILSSVVYREDWSHMPLRYVGKSICKILHEAPERASRGITAGQAIV